MKFIDLFCGLGGFHTGFSKSGYQCVFASEIDENLQELYYKNYGLKPYGDITKIDAKDIPAHDVICAGFPCQPFSLAGQKKGAACPNSGKLIDDVIRIAEYHKPKIIILENVPNILTIADGSFWAYIINSLDKIGYDLEFRIISPIEVGIPQNRKRIFVVAHRQDIKIKESIWPVIESKFPVLLENFLDKSLDHKKLEPRKLLQINKWQNLIHNCILPSRSSYSILAPEFGANYPKDFSSLSLEQMKKYRGAYGQSLSKCQDWVEVMEKLPAYTRKDKKVASWIEPSFQLSRDIYKDNRKFIDSWKKKLDKSNNSWQILEWRGHLDKYDLFSHLIQFRASGIRVLKPEIAPSLIAMTPTQIPIVLKESRYLSKHEAAKLQFLHELKYIPENSNRAFKALGNAVNAKIVGLIALNIKNALAMY